MKKIHIQIWIPITKVAEVAKAMHEKGLYLVKPADILRFCFDSAYNILDASQLSEEEAVQFLKKVGYFPTEEEQRKQSLIATLAKRKTAHDELEDLIEQEMRRGPATSNEIKEMLSTAQKEDKDDKNATP